MERRARGEAHRAGYAHVARAQPLRLAAHGRIAAAGPGAGSRPRATGALRTAAHPSRRPWPGTPLRTGRPGRPCRAGRSGRARRTRRPVSPPPAPRCRRRVSGHVRALHGVVEQPQRRRRAPAAPARSAALIAHCAARRDARSGARVVVTMKLVRLGAADLGRVTRSVSPPMFATIRRLRRADRVDLMRSGERAVVGHASPATASCSAVPTPCSMTEPALSSPSGGRAGRPRRSRATATPATPGPTVHGPSATNSGRRRRRPRKTYAAPSISWPPTGSKRLTVPIRSAWGSALNRPSANRRMGGSWSRQRPGLLLCRRGSRRRRCRAAPWAVSAPAARREEVEVAVAIDVA